MKLFHRQRGQTVTASQPLLGTVEIPSRSRNYAIFQRHRGQTIVEFALILPFVAFLFFGAVYTWMLCTDYSTLTAVAQTEAIRAAKFEYAQGTRHKNVALLMGDWYNFSDGNVPYVVSDAYDEAGNYIGKTVTISVTMKPKNSKSIMGELFGDGVLMHIEREAASTTDVTDNRQQPDGLDYDEGSSED